MSKQETENSLVKVLKEVRQPKLDEHIFYIFVDPTASKVLSVTGSNNLLGTEYLPKAGSIIQVNNDFLTSTLGTKDRHFIGNNKLICVFDGIFDNKIYRAYLSVEQLKDISKELSYIDIKQITDKRNPLHKLYLNIFLKIFSSLELIKYFKN